MITVHTIGHSNHSIEVFLALLKANGIKVLVDVRSKPYSRYQPHFNKEALAAELKREGIQHIWGGTYLGGKSTLSVTDGNFIDKMEKVRSIAEEKPTALMCSEGDPKTCHRAYKLSAWLLKNHPEDKIIHILPKSGTIDGAQFQKQQKAGWGWHEVVQGGTIKD